MDLRTAALCSALTLLCAIARPAAAQEDADAGEPKRLRRKLDHVVMTGAQLPNALASKIDKLRLLAVKDGKLEVIPFQIDERTPSGTYAFDKGGDTKKDTDQRTFDTNDELVFMARDSGDRAPKALTKDLKKFHEIQLESPKRKRKAWVYLAAYGDDEPPPLSDVDYVKITYDKNGRLTYYGKDFITSNERSDGNAVRTSSVRYRRDDKSLTANIVDTTKTRVKIHYFAAAIARNGTEMRVTVGAWIDGPIRVVALNVVEVYLIWGFWVSAPNSLIYFYDYGSEMPTSVDIPVNIDEADPASTARLSTDLSPRARKWFFYNSHNKIPMAIDGVMSDGEKELDTSFPKWNVIYGPEGAMVSRFLFEDMSITTRKYSRLYYSDDLRAKDEPENEVGSYGNIGFELDLSGLKKSVYKGTYYTYYLTDFSYGDEADYLAIVDEPLQLAVDGTAVSAEK